MTDKNFHRKVKFTSSDSRRDAVKRFEIGGVDMSKVAVYDNFVVVYDEYEYNIMMLLV